MSGGESRLPGPARRPPPSCRPLGPGRRSGRRLGSQRPPPPPPQPSPRAAPPVRKKALSSALQWYTMIAHETESSRAGTGLQRLTSSAHSPVWRGARPSAPPWTCRLQTSPRASRLPASLIASRRLTSLKPPRRPACSWPGQWPCPSEQPCLRRRRLPPRSAAAAAAAGEASHIHIG